MPVPKKATLSRTKVASFFAGIGGFDLGFGKSDIEPVFQCEIDSFCSSVLANHWPSVPRHKDILSLKPGTIPDADIWCGGFPCQDVSVARGWLGRDGLKGKNSGLFYPFSRLIKTLEPQVVLLENVPGLLNSHKGQDFAIILHTLSSLGYGVSWRTLNTRYFGAPQSRPRVFICAWKGSADSAYHVLFEKGIYGKPENPRLGFLRPSRCDVTGATVPEVAFCLAATSGRHTGTDWSRSYVAYESEVRRLTPTECERIQGYPAGWTIPGEDFDASGDRIDSLRYKAAGNAVSVPVARWIGRRVRKELKNPALVSKERANHAGIGRFVESSPQLGGSNAKQIFLPEITDHSDAPQIKWANAGVMEDQVCLMGAVSHLPRRVIQSYFVEALEKERPDDKYFLSSNAAKGILRRVDGQGRQLFEPLAEALVRLQSQA